MTNHKHSEDIARFDRADPKPLASIDHAPNPDLADAHRGRLALADDRSAHRRFHSLYEDLLN